MLPREHYQSHWGTEKASNICCQQCGTSAILVAGNHDLKLKLSDDVMLLAGLCFVLPTDYRLQSVDFRQRDSQIHFYALSDFFQIYSAAKDCLKGFPRIYNV